MRVNMPCSLPFMVAASGLAASEMRLGVPAAVEAFRSAREVFAEIDGKSQ